MMRLLFRMWIVNPTGGHDKKDQESASLVLQALLGNQTQGETDFNQPSDPELHTTPTLVRPPLWRDTNFYIVIFLPLLHATHCIFLPDFHLQNCSYNLHYTIRLASLNSTGTTFKLFSPITALSPKPESAYHLSISLKLNVPSQSHLRILASVPT